MACFLVPTGEAIVTTVVKKRVESNETHLEHDSAATISWSQKLKWLNTMLWGGALLLALEHIWHGEVVLYPPFLTAMADTAEMLHEMATVGVGMAVLVTAVWAVMVAVVDHIPAVRATFVGSEA